MRGRRLRALILSLVIGVVLTFVVAAACASIAPFGVQAAPYGTWINDSHRWWIGLWDRSGSTTVMSLHEFKPSRFTPPNDVDGVRSYLPPWAPDLSGYGDAIDRPDAPAQIVHVARATGWPFLATRGVVKLGTPPEFTTALPSGPMETAMWSQSVPRFVPLDPIPAGVLGGTLFYGTLTFALTALLGRVRRAWRRADGRCVFCGYPISIAERCSECGRNASAMHDPLSNEAAVRRFVTSGLGGLALVVVGAVVAARYAPAWRTEPPTPTAAQHEFWTARERQYRPDAPRAVVARIEQLAGPGVTLRMEEGMVTGVEAGAPDRLPVGRLYTVESGWPLRCLRGTRGAFVDRMRLGTATDTGLLRPRYCRVAGAGTSYWRGVPTRVAIGPLLVNFFVTSVIVWLGLTAWAFVLGSRGGAPGKDASRAKRAQRV